MYLQVIKHSSEWFSKNHCNGEVEISLNLIKDQESVDSTVRKAWKGWMGPFDFGKRIMIGNFDMNIGRILIPYNIDEFLNKLSVNISVE